VFEKAEACGRTSAGAIPQRQPDEILLHLSGDALQQLQPFLFFGARAGGGGASLLREPQLGLETGQIFLLPNRQNTLGPCGGGHGEIVHTFSLLIGLSRQFFTK